jgi:transcriptional regulator with XRE-family HTH domain
VATDTADIGQRARTIRRRRGLSLDVAAGLAGISAGYLSRLERGQRSFERRGLLDDLAAALGCAVADLTGQPYLPPDRATADALAALPAVSLALHDTTLDDAPDTHARPLAMLAELAAEANRHTDETRYALAGRDLGAILTELHLHVVAGDAETRRAALAALVEACVAAAGMARPLGQAELAATATRRGFDAARRLGDPALTGFAAMQHASSLTRIGAAHRATAVRTEALAALGETDPTASDTRPAEAEATLCLGIAALAARSDRSGDVDHYFGRAAELVERTGPRETLRFHLSPAQVRAWRLSAAVELGNGPGAAERADSPELFASLASATRTGRAHLDFARAYVQAEGARDAEATRHLDTADRVAPGRIRHDPIARELVGTLHRRARRQVWELDSLRNRFGVT